MVIRARLLTSRFRNIHGRLFFFQVNWSILEFSENKAALNVPRSSQRRLLDMVASLILELKMEAGY